MEKINIKVSPSNDKDSGNWQVTIKELSNNKKYFKTQKDAEKYAIDLGKEQALIGNKAEVSFCKKDGTIYNKNSYGKNSDPSNIKG